MADHDVVDRFLPEAERAKIVAAIAAAEARTSGEIKVHVEPRAPKEQTPYARAIALFGRLGLDRTRERNAVLLYVASEDRTFAIVGDVGIHNEVGDAYWTGAVAALREHFSRSAYAEGLIAAVSAIGERLAARFPPVDAPGKKENQLSDDISTSEPAKS